MLRITRVNGRAIERNIVGVINTGLKCLSSDGSLVALGLTDTHDVGEASEPAQRANPVNGTTTIYRYHQIQLVEKHAIKGVLLCREVEL